MLKFLKRFISVPTNVQIELESVQSINTPAKTPQPSYHEKSRLALQSQLDHSGQALKLTHQEYAGPLYIRKPLIIEGQGATLWAFKGPVLYINSSHVTIKNLNIEVTGDIFATLEEECAICINESAMIHFENVQVRGQVMGLEGESGPWQYPHSLHLGKLAKNMVHYKRFVISVPIQCHLESAISGVQVIPSFLQPGTAKVQIQIEPLFDDISLQGSLYLKSAQLKRRIHLTAHILSLENCQPTPQVLDSSVPTSQQKLQEKQDIASKEQQTSQLCANNNKPPKPHSLLTKPMKTENHLKRLERSVFFKEAETVSLKDAGVKNSDDDNVFFKTR